MNQNIQRILFSLLAALMLIVPVAANGQKKESAQKNQYQNIEVVRFDVKEGIDFPAEYLNGVMDQLVTELKNTKKFKQVFREGEAQTDAATSTIRLTGTVTQFKTGSRTKRYLVGFGAGKTKIVAHVKFVDKATGNVLFEKDVDGKVIIGVFGGESKGATRGVAKEVAKVAKKQFF